MKTTYVYTLLNLDGEFSKVEVDATSEAEAIRCLGDQGYYPTHLYATDAIAKKTQPIRRRQKISIMMPVITFPRISRRDCTMMFIGAGIFVGFTLAAIFILTLYK
jgi:type II secretory pathway component PulF